MARTVTVLGSTGSIGRSTLDLIRANRADYEIVALTAGRNADALIEQAKVLKPRCVAIADDAGYAKVKDALSGTGVLCLGGTTGVIEAAAMEADWTMAGIVGMAGLEPTLAAIRRGRTVAFASKECLVSAGALMMEYVRSSGATLLPVDSEHNAIFQVFENENRAAVRRLILTASGGPFRTFSTEQMAVVTSAQAVNHPTWAMGAKISVDSATMMNKALEVIEAHHLFAIDHKAVDVIVHPQSIVHSMVEYIDGSVLAQLGPSDMRTPIASCLAWPQRMATSGPMLDFAALMSKGLQFEAPDLVRFPALAMVRDVLDATPADAVVFNAANEIAVAAFLQENVGFTDICAIIDHTLDKMQDDLPHVTCLDDVINLDHTVRSVTRDIVASWPRDSRAATSRRIRNG